MAVASLQAAGALRGAESPFCRPVGGTFPGSARRAGRALEYDKVEFLVYEYQYSHDDGYEQHCANASQCVMHWSFLFYGFHEIAALIIEPDVLFPVGMVYVVLFPPFVPVFVLELFLLALEVSLHCIHFHRPFYRIICSFLSISSRARVSNVITKFDMLRLASEALLSILSFRFSSTLKERTSFFLVLLSFMITTSI